MFEPLQDLIAPVLVLVVTVALFAAAFVFSRNYIKVSPNAVAVLSGRRRKLPDGRTVGYRMVRGGAALRIPLLEKVEYLHLNVMTIPLEIKRAYTLKGVPVSVKAVANVKIRGDETSLQAAAERFLGMTHVEVQKVIFQTLEGHLRSILGTLTVEEVPPSARRRPRATPRSSRRRRCRKGSGRSSSPTPRSPSRNATS
jgi:flotillin